MLTAAGMLQIDCIGPLLSLSFSSSLKFANMSREAPHFEHCRTCREPLQSGAGHAVHAMGETLSRTWHYCRCGLGGAHAAGLRLGGVLRRPLLRHHVHVLVVLDTRLPTRTVL